jgi:ATP-dependent Clp protease adaptor protein ClpS
MIGLLRVLFALLILDIASAFSPSLRPQKSFRATTSTRAQAVTLSSVIEKEKFGGPAILERPAVERREKVDEPVQQRRNHGSEAWEVRIYNDGLNTREHVARSLVQVTGLSELRAYQTMMQAHQNGIAVVGRWVYEIAEMYHDALKNKGIVCDIIPVDEEY